MMLMFAVLMLPGAADLLAGAARHLQDALGAVWGALSPAVSLVVEAVAADPISAAMLAVMAVAAIWFGFGLDKVAGQPRE